MAREEMVWDLSQLVESTDPVAIQKQLRWMVDEAEKIRVKYHGKIGDLDAKGLLELLETRDAYRLKYDGVGLYCELIYSADSTDSVAKQLYDAVRRASVKVGQALAFIDLELGSLLTKEPSRVSDPILAEYRHYLEKILRRTPHMLSEIEERLIIMKDKDGISAWETLQSDWLSTRAFDIEIEGRMKTLPYGEIIGLFQSPDRDLRKRANQIVYENLGKYDIIWASAIRSVCEDHLQMCKLRKYPIPMTQSLIVNDVDQQTIDRLLETIRKNVKLYHRYLKLKAKLMGLDKLANYDLRAPLPKSRKVEYSWTEARKEVVDSYFAFDDEVGNAVKEMFEKNHLDGKVRKGKTSGAFSASWQSGKSAYILQSFNGRMGDVFTQAHELGHAVHAYLGSRAQKPSNFDEGSCIAETGSVFGELLLAERLLSKARTKEEKQAILVNVLDGFCSSAFQVSARVFFEQSMYDAIERGDFLDGEFAARLWVQARDIIFSGSVDFLDVMKWAWVVTPHYYLANYRFYNYPYVFAQLFVYALYKLYKEQDQSFVPKLKRLLAARGSKSPRELAAELGFDITEEGFWEKGMKQAKEFIDMLEENL